MSFSSFFIPHRILRSTSRYNSDIGIIEEWGQLKLLVNGSRQSGPSIEKLWEKAFSAFGLKTASPPTSILVLGVGGGTVIQMLSEVFPWAHITAVDIDEVIIGIGKKYFHLDGIANLHIVRRDAKVFVSMAAKSKTHYDLVVVDVFIGRTIPEFIAEREFYQSVKHLLQPGGMMIVNYLRELEYREKSDALMGTLTRMFHEVHDYSIANNRFFFART